VDVQELAEYRCRAVREVLGGSPIGEVAARYGASRQTHRRHPAPGRLSGQCTSWTRSATPDGRGLRPPKRDRALRHRLDVTDAPSLDHCQPSCANIARTDRHADELPPTRRRRRRREVLFSLTRLVLLVATVVFCALSVRGNVRLFDR
jgi:hypothetical protein